MQTAHQKRIEQFMKCGEQEVPTSPVVPPLEIRRLRAKLIFEEAQETINALGFELLTVEETGEIFLSAGRKDADICLEDIADGCADVSVVTIGTLSACGIRDQPLLEEVDANNLSKFDDGWYKRDDGKIMKSPSWTPPKIKEVLEKQHQEANVLANDYDESGRVNGGMNKDGRVVRDSALDNALNEGQGGW